MDNFSHFRVKSEYSLTNSIVKIDALVNSALERNINAIALTDNSNLFGLVKFYTASIKTGIKPIIGADIYIKYEDRISTGLFIVKNNLGYKQLSSLISKAYFENYQGNKPIINFEWLNLETTSGLIFINGGTQTLLSEYIRSHKKNDSNVLILGAGGAARAAAVQCLLDGCNRLFVVNRSLERLKNLVTPLIQKFGSHRVSGSDLKNFTLSEFEHKKWLVVNATSVGLKEDDPSALPFSCSLLGKGSAVYDMIYNPLKTTLLKEADHAGLLSANGLSMLVFQAAKALEVWTQKKVSAEIMMKAAKDYFLRSNE